MIWGHIWDRSHSLFSSTYGTILTNSSWWVPQVLYEVWGDLWDQSHSLTFSTNWTILRNVSWWFSLSQVHRWSDNRYWINPIVPVWPVQQIVHYIINWNYYMYCNNKILEEGSWKHLSLSTLYVYGLWSSDFLGLFLPLTMNLDPHIDQGGTM